MTSVKIIDFNYVHYVNAEVEVLLPEESGIVQIEVQPCAHPALSGIYACLIKQDKLLTGLVDRIRVTAEFHLLENSPL